MFDNTNVVQVGRPEIAIIEAIIAKFKHSE
jgi:hypothetical protein